MTNEDFLIGGIQYEVTMVSDVQREGSGMEVSDPRDDMNGFALWFDDTTGSKTIIADCKDLPLELVTKAIALFEERVVNG
jgi:hypothetical protein